MEIKHCTEKEDGSVIFQGTLEGNELRVVIETGLNVLLANGLLPFLASDEDDNVDWSKVMEGTTTTQ